MTTADLIKRVESARGPDRELAKAIYLACGYKIEQRPEHNDNWYLVAPDGEVLEHFGSMRDVTSSLDAAVSLCERVLTRRHDWQISRLSILVEGEQYAAKVYAVDGGYHSASEAFGATPALALVLAVLRAHLDTLRAGGG